MPAIPVKKSIIILTPPIRPLAEPEIPDEDILWWSWMVFRIIIIYLILLFKIKIYFMHHFPYFFCSTTLFKGWIWLQKWVKIFRFLSNIWWFRCRMCSSYQAELIELPRSTSSTLVHLMNIEWNFFSSTGLSLLVQYNFKY